MRQLIALVFALALLAPPAAAQRPVISDGPDSVSITVYRDPDRQPDEEFNLGWLEGYALITETRHMLLPAGENEIRFEGVAAGIIPQSAIVAGLPDGVLERNRDALLLSPEGLLDASLGRRVTVRRTNPASGIAEEISAIVRSGPAGAVVLETSEGIEALRCSGLPETLVFEGVPEGLSARPTLSVRSRTSRAIEADVTLSYLATGFDWQADYVVTIRGGRLDLFAWVTIANGDSTGFADASAAAVAGRPNREDADVVPARGGAIRLRCWPSGVSYPILVADRARRPDLESVSPLTVVGAEEIAVTGRRVARGLIAATAELEELADLKLYRIPVPVTVAARSQKQVALLSREGVPFTLLHRSEPVWIDEQDRDWPLSRTLRMENRSRDGLGLPLPQGQAMIFETGADRPVLIGEAPVVDTPVGRRFDLVAGPSPAVLLRSSGIVEDGPRVRGVWRVRYVATNARREPALVEVPFRLRDDQRVEHSSASLDREFGRPIWRVTVPANSIAELELTISETD